MITLDKRSVTFAVPRGWEEVSAKTLDRPGVRDAVKPMAQNSGLSPEQFIEKYSKQVDLLVVDTGSSDSFADNINILPSSARSLPSLGELKNALEGISAVTEQGETVATETGEGLRQDYQLNAGAQDVYGASLVLKNGDGSYSQVTVSAGDASARDTLTEQLLNSWKKS